MKFQFRIQQSKKGGKRGETPYLVGTPEEWKLGLEVLVDLVEGELLSGHGLDGHHDQGDVAVRRLLLAAGA